jgi:Fe-S cluster assembly scaffold protein SufB
MAMGVKEAIRHPKKETRHTTVQYWSESVTENTSVISKAIKAVEQYGRYKAFSLLRKAEHLPQTEQTVEWAINDLQQSPTSVMSTLTTTAVRWRCLC